MKVSIAVIDVGLGNVNSILNMFLQIGVDAKLVQRPDQLIVNSKIILPGVGKFDEGVRLLRQSGFFHVLQNENHNILGICLGMQLLCRKSEEGSLPGLGIIPADVKKMIPGNTSQKIPHMGWNSVRVCRNNALVKKEDSERYYFVHSYHAVCDNEENVFLKTNYGSEFASGICQGNVFGVQFHPEKSHKYGLRLLKNFADIESC